MAKRQVCILSMQRVQNLGSLLQSYALKKMLESQGCDVRFLDIESREEDNSLRHGKMEHYNSEVEASSGILGKLRKIDRYTWNRIRIKKLSNRQNQYFEQFRNDVLNIKDEDNKRNYDLCVIGSDEVFNCLAPAQWGFTTQLFGNVPQADSVITFAASCGGTELGNLNEEMKQAICRSLEKVSAFSVRDDNTRSFVAGLTGREDIVDSCDPVWCWDFSRERADAALPDGLPERYCIVYSYYNRIHSIDEINAIKAFCKEHHLTPVAVGAPQMWLKHYMVAPVFQLLKVFENAEFIITDTFHGTILAEKLNGRYAVLIRDSNRNKLGDLLKKIQSEEHLIENFKDLDTVYGDLGDRDRSVQNQKAACNSALEYLKDYCVQGALYVR